MSQTLVKEKWDRVPIRSSHLTKIRKLKKSHPEIKNPTDFVDEAVTLRLEKFNGGCN